MTALLERPCGPLPPADRFRGSGIYALYYTGEFPPYTRISSKNCDVPIYVGKAEPPGRRIGLRGIEAQIRRSLYNRLKKHGDSINSAENLRLDDFRCRYLLVEDLWIPLGETLLIERFRPLWNVAVEGFGLNDPGSRRHGGDRSDWDELHPGRSWREHMRQKRTADAIEEDIRRHLAQQAN